MSAGLTVIYDNDRTWRWETSEILWKNSNAFRRTAFTYVTKQLSYAQHHDRKLELNLLNNNFNKKMPICSKT